ncbi:MAG: nucleotidyltransferase family protein, partial [Phycisphaerae bacterium]
MMHLLERVAAKFNEAGVALLVLKGAALNLTVYESPQDRPMCDLDLMVHEQDVDRARVLLEKLGFLRGEPLVREDFFPRFYYETHYISGSPLRVTIDLHVRPFRPLRYACIVPADAFWANAEEVTTARARV